MIVVVAEMTSVDLLKVVGLWHTYTHAGAERRHKSHWIFDGWLTSYLGGYNKRMKTSLLTNRRGDMLINSGRYCASIILEDLMYKRLTCEAPFFMFLLLFMNESIMLLNPLHVLVLVERLTKRCTTSIDLLHLYLIVRRWSKMLVKYWILTPSGHWPCKRHVIDRQRSSQNTSTFWCGPQWGCQYVHA